jgi:hemerythrin HHE cation binding domain-containing protein
MNPVRHDIYRAIHKGLRAALFDVTHRLGLLDADDPEDLRQTLDQAQRLLALLTGHLKHENDFVHAAIEARLPGGAQHTAEDHHTHLEDIAGLDAEIVGLRQAAPGERGAIAHRLYLHFARFAGENLEHMLFEETHNNATLWTLYGDDEIEALHGRLVASIAPAEMMQALGWMARALNPAELAALLAGMRAKAPPEAFGAALGHVRQALSPHRWARLAQSLGLSLTPAA